MSANGDVIVLFRIYGQIASIRKPDFRQMVNKTHIFVNNKFYLTKTEIRTNKISNTALILFFE